MEESFPESQAEEEAEELEAEVDSNEFFCRFTPSQIDRMASHILGERPLCEKWISRDGKNALLYGLKLSRRKPTPGYKPPGVKDLVDAWNQKFKR